MDTSWDIKQILRATLIVAVTGLSVWMLWRLLPAIGWAVVLAIGTWPLRVRLADRGMGKTKVAALLTLLIAIVIVVPLIRIGVEAVHNGSQMAAWINTSLAKGFPAPPEFFNYLPYGKQAATWWQSHVTGKGPTALLNSFGLDLSTLTEHLDASRLLNVTSVLGTAVASRLAILVFCLVTLFFLYRDGQSLMDQAQAITARLVGPTGGKLGENAVIAVRASVNGVVLVALAEGLLLGIAYQVAGLPYATSLGLLTAVFSTLPFGSVLVFAGCAVVLYFEGSTLSAIALLIFGSLVVFVADHVVRQMIIGRATSLPFLAVLLGVVGGLETFDVIGLFLGPAIMSVMVAMWREGAEGA
jgi:predicted PurR-regulated permease PerM